MAKKQTAEAVSPDVIQRVPPSVLIGDENSRFGLKANRIETMKQAILAQGGILVPLEVVALASAVNGAKYRIEDGHYRHAAALELSKEFDGIDCPVIVRTPQADETPLKRLMRQTAINMEREALSPMDIAVAIKQMYDGGIPRQEIRNLFQRPGGRKGNKVQQLSNSMMNIYMSFLDFPKDIQAKIHDGIIGVAAAYKLSTKPAEKWAEIVAECEAEREEELKADEQREERYLSEVKKGEEREAKQKELELAAVAAQTAVDEKAKLADEKIKAEADALAALRKGAADNEAKKKLEEHSAAAKADSVAAVKALEDAKKEAEKAAKKLETVREEAAKRAAKLAEARAAAANKKAPAPDKAPAPIGAGQVDRAANKLGGSTLVKLTAQQMRQAVHDWTLPGSFPKVQALAQVIMKCFDSELTPAQAYTELGKLTGEAKPTTKKK